MEVFKELKKFQEDRLLHKQDFELHVASLNIIEELLEAHGISEDRQRILSNSIYGMMGQAVKQIKNEDLTLDGVAWTKPTVYSTIDAFCDIQVFAGGEVGKLGFDNELAMAEVATEINSREGEIINGKFCKWTDEGSKARWYKADFKKALEPDNGITHD